jgi:hypothetical protein
MRAQQPEDLPDEFDLPGRSDACIRAQRTEHLPDEFDVPGRSDEFMLAREAAFDGHCRLLVHITEKRRGASLLNDQRLRLFLDRIHFFVCRDDEPSGAWFRSAYQRYTEDKEAFCLLNPETGEVLSSRPFSQNLAELQQWLADFLDAEQPAVAGKPPPRAAPPLATVPLRPVPGPLVSVMIEYGGANGGSRKRATIEIGAAETVACLYEKVAALVGADPSAFRLVYVTARGFVDLTDREETIAEAGCSHSCLRVMPG